MFLTMAISIYSSRVVLNVLGVEDYGIYNVVGGVVAMFSFLNGSMSSASARFLTMELRCKDGNVQRMFSGSVTVHLIVAVIVFLLAETVGLWFLENKLIIPPERFNTARIIYQLSVLSAIRNITQVPYNALIIANEKFDVYAYIEILNVLLRLGILFVLPLINMDKLLLYGILVFSIALLIALIYRIYCRMRFPDSTKFTICKDKPLLKEMLSFSGWDLYGNMSVMARTQGVNMLLNMFFGPILNAAAGIATAVQGAVGAFASNVMTAVKPQIFKRYAAGEYESAIFLMTYYTKFSFILLSLLSLPLILETEYILKIWLKIVPDYAVSFCRLTLLFNLSANISSSLMSVIHATGKIKKSSLINGTLYLSVIPITYFLFRSGSSPIIPFLFNVILVCGGFTLNSLYLGKYLDEFSPVKYLWTIIKLTLALISSYIIIKWSVSFIENQLIRLAASIIGSICIMSTISYFAVFSVTERYKIKNMLSQWTRKKI